VAASDPGNSVLRLMDPFGRVVFFNGNGITDQDTIVLPATGTYTLLVEGWVANPRYSQQTDFTLIDASRRTKLKTGILCNAGVFILTPFI